MKYTLSESARLDLVEIVRYIARDNPVAARRFAERLRARMRAAARMPRSGRHVPEWPADDVREVLVGNYRIVYRVVVKGIVVLAIVEGHRLIGT